MKKDIMKRLDTEEVEAPQERMAEGRSDMTLTEREARKMAEEKVYVHMTLGDIHDACREFGIKVIKNRHTMEQKLIETYRKKWTGKEGD